MGMTIEEENFDFIGKMIDKISMKVTETQEKYIFETIKPYCDYITKHEITKEELAEALLLRQNYETRLKADMVAMLTEIQLEIEEKEQHYQDKFIESKNTVHGAAMGGRMFGCGECKEIIQQKIDALKEVKV